MKVERPRLALMTQFLPDRSSVVLLQTRLYRDYHKDRNSVSSPFVIIFLTIRIGRGPLRGLGPLCGSIRIFYFYPPLSLSILSINKSMFAFDNILFMVTQSMLFQLGKILTM